MISKEAREMIEQARNFTKDWASENGMTEIHQKQLFELARGLGTVVAISVDMMSSPNQIPEELSDDFENPAQMAHYVLYGALIATFQMGRASAIGDK